MILHFKVEIHDSCSSLKGCYHESQGYRSKLSSWSSSIGYIELNGLAL